MEKIAWPGMPIPVPPGMRVDPLRIYHNAERLPAHQALRTKLVGVELNGATLAVDWREELVGDVETGALMGGVVTTLLDHATGLSMLTQLGGEGGSGSTLDLRIDYFKPSTRGRRLLVEARCHRVTRHIAFVGGRAFHPDRPDDDIARGAGTYAVIRGGPDPTGAASTVPDIVRQEQPALPLTEPFPDLVARARDSRDFSLLTRTIPYFALLGLEAGEENGELIVTLPGWGQHMANLNPPLLHGGVIGALLEATAILHLLSHNTVHVAKTISFTTDFLRAAPMAPLHARAIVVRMGRRVANIRCEAWQDDPARLMAAARGNFLLT